MSTPPPASPLSPASASSEPRRDETPDVWRSPVRAYRDQCAPRPEETRFRVVVDESDLAVTASRDHSTRVERLVRSTRGRILNWTALHPEFRTSLDPLPVPDHAPDVVRRMCAAGLAAGVGPFAAVAGTIAQLIAEDLAAAGETDCIVENGGDLYMYSSRDRVVGLLPDPASGLLIGVGIRACDCPLALCASSARIGHSFSFGQGDLAVVRARDAALADAAATALCNMLRRASDVERVLARARSMPGVDGVFAQCGGRVGLWGLELAEALQS